MLSASNRLICCDWRDGVWQNMGKGGTTHGGSEFATPPEKVEESVSAVGGVRWPPVVVGSLGAEDVDPEEVAKWLLLHRWSFSERGPEHGYGGPGCEVRTTRASWTTAGRDACLERPKLSERVEAIPSLPSPVSYTGSADDVHPSGDLSGCVIYIDKDYEGTTPYKHSLPTSTALSIARRWAALGATVCLSEARPLTELGWHTLDITGARKGQKRTFSKQQAEWLTCNREMRPLPEGKGSTREETPPPREGRGWDALLSRLGEP